MTVNELERLYNRALGIQQAKGVGDLPKSVRDDIAGLVDAIGQAIAEAAFVADDRATPADAEWFAGLDGVSVSEGYLTWCDANEFPAIRYAQSGLFLYCAPWPGGPPTRGQALDVMAGLGKKGGDA